MKYSTSFITASAVVVSQLAGVVAHGGVLSYSNAGNWYWGWQPYNSPTGQTTLQRPWSSYNPIQNMTDPTIACNDNGAAGALQLTAANIQAGSSITAYWNQVWPHDTGPVTTYLSACPSSGCTSVNTATAEWFKIQEAGLINGTIYSGTWAAGVMIAQNSSWTTVIPETIPSGYYFIRFETIALHSMPAQSYPECAQIQIVGGSNPTPAPADILVTFPGAYSQNDPGLNIDIYDSQAEVTYNYTIPGPPLYAGGTGNPSNGSPPPTTSSPAPTTSSVPPPTSKAPTTTSASPSSTPSSSGGTAPIYGQCGGIGWTGATTCAAGSTCTVSNQYYSQCLPT